MESDIEGVVENSPIVGLFSVYFEELEKVDTGATVENRPTDFLLNEFEKSEGIGTEDSPVGLAKVAYYYLWAIGKRVEEGLFENSPAVCFVSIYLVGIMKRDAGVVLEKSPKVGLVSVYFGGFDKSYVFVILNNAGAVTEKSWRVGLAGVSFCSSLLSIIISFAVFSLSLFSAIYLFGFSYF